MKKVLVRANNTVQVGASAEERRRQAAEAYAVVGKIDEGERYLLVDDVWTTGSSMLAACSALRKAGAKKVSIAVIAKSEEMNNRKNLDK